MVDAMPVPDSRQKVDELFLYWLSEPSTQEMLRKELTKVCRYGNDLTADGGDSSILDNRNLVQPTLTNVQRPSSPNYRTPSPPLHLSNSPKSPRTKRRARSPRRNLKTSGLGLGGLSHPDKSAVGGFAAAFDDVDYFPAALTSSPLPFDPESREKSENVAGNTVGGKEGEDTKRKLDTSSPQASAQVAERKNASKSEKTASRPTEVIPQFFFPNGKLGACMEGVDEQLKEAAKVFQLQQNGEISQEDFHLVVKVILCNVEQVYSAPSYSLFTRGF